MSFTYCREYVRRREIDCPIRSLEALGASDLQRAACCFFFSSPTGQDTLSSRDRLGRQRGGTRDEGLQARGKNNTTEFRCASVAGSLPSSAYWLWGVVPETTLVDFGSQGL